MEVDSQESHSIIRLLYQNVKTDDCVATYVCVQYFRQGNRDQILQESFRQSSPYVLARSYGHRRVIPGSVCESVMNLKSQLQQLGGALHELVPKVENASGQQRNVEYEKYERHLVNSLILISCLARNLFHRFPRLAEQFYVQMYDYEGKLSERIRVKNLLDLFVHNRYINLQNEYITDLVSEQPPESTLSTEAFMGHRFKFGEFLRAIEEATDSITIKDLTIRLRGGIKSLNLDTPYQDIVFLVQNMESLSQVLEATIPTRGYDFILNTLFPASEIPEKVLSAAGRREVKNTIRFRSPHVKICDDIDDKKVSIAITHDIEYRVAGKVVHSALGQKRRKDVDYESFFDNVINQFGNEPLLTLGNRVENWRIGT